jgi:hypothetical protein
LGAFLRVLPHAQRFAASACTARPCPEKMRLC